MIVDLYFQQNGRDSCTDLSMFLFPFLYYDVLCMSAYCKSVEWLGIV